MNYNDATRNPALQNPGTVFSESVNHENPMLIVYHDDGTREDGVTAHSPGSPHLIPVASNDENQQHESRSDPNHTKRSRTAVCKACRESKVRCESDPTDAGGPCKRCKRSGRHCIAAVPRPKGQKKSKSLVAELGKKIDALTASLHDRGTGTGVAMISPPPTEEQRTFATTWHDDEMKRNLHPFASGNDPSPTGTAFDAHTVQIQPGDVAMMMATPGQRRAVGGSDLVRNMEYHPPPMTMTSQYRDVVDRGILPIGTATKLLERYNSKMLQHLPAVVLPPQISITELRHTKPILFLSLVAASSAEMPTLQRQLATELMEILAEKVFIRSEKSLEIVQALHLAVVWYWMPGYFEDMDFYRLVYIGAVMAIDIGLGQDTQGMKATASYQRRNYASPPPDPTTIESRRTWLTCYFLAASTSMTFHRPNLVQWTPFLAECVSVLENSPDAAPTDKYFCHMVWTHHLAEEVLLDFSMGDPMTVLDITDLRARCFLRVLERSLEEYASPIPQGLMQPTLRMTLHVVSLRMHEIALNCEAKEDMKPPFDTATLKEGMLREESLTPSHVNALSSCLTAISGIFETFLGMDLDSIRSLPAFSFARVAYAITILVRIGLSAMKPNSELGKIANNESMKVTYYLDRLLHKFSDAAADNRCRSVVKFLAVVDMLRSWFLEQVEGHNPAS